ncbi:gastric triacylglycerol lipase-like [Spodoptera litura]|uniref:Lipase n=1 Tax=Spodoptera litura TaxID=69820 RepID=A0A9J7EGI9_SPOLT|nr:gastric triacylglycerol lipase-like [Spodoptera litura]
MYIYLLLLVCKVSNANLVEDRGLWSVLGSIVNFSHSKFVPEDANLSITELGKKYGYHVETHLAITEDGYILNFHRIPMRNGKAGAAVFLMHGILESSDTWMLLGPNKALAYLLADHGFDVWLGNSRGNKYCEKHVTLNNTLSEFWHFSWEEIAVKDLPAMIDYILQKTGLTSLYYVGHSQGTTTGYVLCAMKPEYNDKINIMFSLAPEAWMGHLRSPIVKMFSPAHNLLAYLLSDFNAYYAGVDFFNKISTFVCTIAPARCDNILFALSGYESKINDTFLSVILGHSPSGTSTFQFAHYGQLIESQRFCRYDFGKERNLMKYNQSRPPDYDLSKVTTPVVLFYSDKDLLSDPKDVNILRKHLKNVQESIFVEDFTHLDYVYAEEAANVVYSKIVGRIISDEEKRAKKHNYTITPRHTDTPAESSSSSSSSSNSTEDTTT